MAQGLLISKADAARLAQRSIRTIDRNKEALGHVGGMVDGRKVVELAPREPDQMSLVLTPTGPNLTEGDRAEAERRYGVIEPLLHPERYPLLWAAEKTKGSVIAWIAAQHKVAPRTVYHWWQGFRKRGGLTALVTKDRADKGRPRLLSPAAWDFVLASALSQGPTSAEMYRAYEEERAWRESHVGKKQGDFGATKYARYLDEDGRLKQSAMLPAISYKTFVEWTGKVPDLARVLAREGEEAYRNTQEIISWRDIGAVDPMDYVVMDHRVLDVFCLFRDRGGWRLARPWLTAAIDMRTRKWLAWVIVEQPSSDSIGAVLKRVFMDFGLPKACYWDNGKDFRCQWFEGAEARSRRGSRVEQLETAWRGVLGTLGVRVHHAIPYNARAKIIEANFGRLGKFDASLPEWCGHKTEARPERFDALVRDHEQWVKGTRTETPFRSVDQIARLYGDAIRDLNERPLEGDGMRKATPTGMGWWCPNEAWDILARGVARRPVPADVLHLCFAKRRELTVKHGEVQVTFDARPYHYRIDGEPAQLMALNGQTVELAYDPLDLAEAAIYWQGRFVGLARCVALRKMGEDQFVDDERLRRAARREVKKAIAVVHAQVPLAGAVERLGRRRAIAPAREEVCQAVTAVEIPAAVLEAAEAVRASRELPAVIEVERAEVASGDEAEDFEFFKS